ncbi:MAG: efflux RND transporter periplasmic adaptor subunit, partial [Acidaminobacteraceae bacterium]
MRKMRSGVFLTLAVTMIMSFSACESSELGGDVLALTKPVKIVSVKNEMFDDYITYIGSVNSQKTVKLGFKSSGKLSKLNVKIGDKIEVGTSLATLEPIDINFALDDARSQFNSAKSQVKKAKDTMAFMESTYLDLGKLYEAGSISKQQLDESKLKFDIATSDYNLAQSSQSQAQINLNQKLDLKGELNLKSPVEGIVLDIINESGEIIGAGQPVIIIRNNNQTAVVGVNQEDLGKIDLDTKVSVAIDESNQNGTIIRISEVPDSATRTYEVEVMLGKSDVPLGAIGEVKFIIGEFTG